MTPQLWPIFICYRRVDGAAAARRLHETLDKWEAAGPDGTTIRIDAYLDASVPGIADWKAVHRPYLEKARALIVVCTPGLKLNEGAGDWVHQEIDWWMTHRTAAPILIDPLREGIRYVPVQIASRWPDIQRIQLVEEEWGRLSGSALEQKTRIFAGRSSAPCCRAEPTSTRRSWLPNACAPIASRSPLRSQRACSSPPPHSARTRGTGAERRFTTSGSPALPCSTPRPPHTSTSRACSARGVRSKSIAVSTFSNG